MGDTAFAPTTPIGRWLAWFEGLDAPLRAHLAVHLVRGDLLGSIDDDDDAQGERRAGRTTLALRLHRAARDPARDAELAVALAERTDRALADPALRASWTGEDELRHHELDARASDPGIDDHLRRRREQTTERSLEWMSACDAWARLRSTGLADRRIGRWREKQSTTDGDHHA